MMMRFRWLAVTGIVLIISSLALHTIAPRMWPTAYFGQANITGMMQGGMMQGGMMQGGMMQGGMMQGGMMQGGMMQGGMMHDSMMSGQVGGDPSQPFDLRWLDSMIVHHQGAVISTQHMIAQSQRPELRDLAQRIITAQQKEIDQMRQWRTAWYPDAPTGPDMTGMAAMMESHEAQGDMHAGMMGAMDRDSMYLQMMIPHHQAAITMAEQALAQTEHAELKNLSQNIITSQRAEIEEMRGYLKAWYNVTVP